MFILRVMPKKGAAGTKDIHGIETNQILGDRYQFVERFANPDEFSKAYRLVFGKPHVADNDSEADNYSRNCYAFISTQGNYYRPLYRDQHNWIMTDTGNTFANVTFK